MPQDGGNTDETIDPDTIRPHAVAVAAIASLIQFVDTIPPGTTDDNLPDSIDAHHWSAFNVPIFWEAAGSNNNCATITWMSTLLPQFVHAWPAFATFANAESANNAFRHIWYGMRQLGIVDENALQEWFNANDTQGRRYDINCYFGRSLQERFIDNISQNVAAARDIEWLYFAIGLFKDSRVRLTLARTLPQQGPSQPISDPPPHRPPGLPERPVPLSTTAAGATHRRGRPGVARLPDGWRHIDAVDIRQEINVQVRTSTAIPKCIRDLSYAS